MTRFCMIAVVLFCVPSLGWADQPKNVFDGFWSVQCVDQKGGLVTDYSVFTPTEWCRYIADDQKTHSLCLDTSYVPEAENGAILKVEGAGRYRALWRGRVLELQALDHEEVIALSPAKRREDGRDRFLTCP